VYLRSRGGIGYLPQESSVFLNLTVCENLELVYEEMGRPDAKAARKLMEQFGISRIADTKGYALSGGERRRVEIARAMPLSPAFILLDEPFSGIDPIAVSDIQSMVYELKAQNFGVLITDHNVRETLTVLDRGYIIANGQIIVSGTADDIILNKLTRDIYLGDKFRI
jgi:lipopolysaccharide export system ATP-binding protein